MSISVLSPSSISKKQSADFRPSFAGLSDHEKKVLRNRKRGLRIATNARTNKELYESVCGYMEATDLTTQEQMYFCNLRHALSSCCQHSLYRRYDNGAVEYIASQTCKHKMCMVCNAERAKMVRRKYLRYFSAGQMTDRKTGEVSRRQDFDYMHLTLTVPHTEGGWSGKQWYAPELMAAFNKMRKCQWWSESVWGGEFGVEVTKNDSGLHIHIHSLLIVRKAAQSRNTLQRNILIKWNELTVDRASNRKRFTDEEKAAIKKGTPAITAEEIAILNPRGATLIGLESLYTLTSKRQSLKDKWIADKGKWKHYINPADEGEFMGGVLECLKYHFEPVAMDKETGVYQFELLRTILPHIFRKPLYRKFGNLHGVKELNINETVDNRPNGEDIAEVIEEIGEEATNPDTGQPDSAFAYVVVNAATLYYDTKKNLRPAISDRARQRVLQTDNIYDAITQMIFMDMKIAAEYQRGEAVRHRSRANNEFINSQHKTETVW